MDRVEFIARVRYLGWICYQLGANLPLHDVPSDYSISQERLESLMGGTEAVLSKPDMTPEENHREWALAKLAQGYTYGPVLDTDKKTHPSLVPFKYLSDVERRKDEMDILMVHLVDKLYNQIFNESGEEQHDS